MRSRADIPHLLWLCPGALDIRQNMLRDPKHKPNVSESYTRWIMDNKSANSLLQYLHHTKLHMQRIFCCFFANFLK